MTIKELAQAISPDIDLFIRFNGDELVYSQPIAAIVGDIIIDHIEADTSADGATVQRCNYTPLQNCNPLKKRANRYALTSSNG